MKKKLKIIVLTIIISQVLSCKNKEEELAKEERLKKYQIEMISDLNKDYLYCCGIISIRTKISIKVVKPVVKEFFISQFGYVFDENSFNVSKESETSYDTKHNLDLIKETSEKYFIPYIDVLTIYSELENFTKFDELQEEISTLDAMVQDLDGKINE